MKKLSKLLLVLMMVSVFFSCEQKEDPTKPKRENPEFTINIPSPKIGENVVLTAKVDMSEVESIKWMLGTQVFDGESITIKFTDPGEITITLKIKFKDEDRYYESTKKITVQDVSVITHSENITKDEVWKSEYTHIVKSNIEIVNATLTIEPGTTIKFEEDAGLRFGENEMQNSKLVAQGTADKHIIFTSAKASKQAGDWHYLLFGEFSSTESIMEYCDISYAGGYAEYSGSIVIVNKSITFNHNTVTQSESAGIACGKDAFFESFEDNEVKECKGNAINIYANYVHTLGTKQATPSRIDGSSLHGIYVDGDLDTKGNFVWQNLGSRYTITHGTLDIGSTHGTTLTIEKGCTISFMESAGIKIGCEDNKTGNLIAKGTADEKIKFVTEKVGNSGGNWDYLYFGEYTAEGSVLDHCVIDGGGDYAEYSASLRLDKAVISCTNTEIKNSVTDGIQCSNEGHFSKFANNTISNSKKSSIVIHANWVHLIETNNNIADDGYGIAIIGRNFDHKEGEFTWLKQSCPYTIMGQPLDIGSKKTCSLVIEAGTTVRFVEDAGITVGADDNEMGKLIAKGTENNKIKFIPMVASGSWDFINFQSGTAEGSILENCEIIRAGSYADYSAAVVCNASLANTPTVRNCLIKDSQSNGLWRNSNAVVENVTYENSAGEDEKVEN